LVGAALGWIASNMLFGSCTTQTKGKTTTKVCTKSNGIQKASGAALGAIGINYLLDNLNNVTQGIEDVTSQLRHRPVTEPSPVTYHSTPAN